MTRKYRIQLDLVGEAELGNHLEVLDKLLAGKADAYAELKLPVHG